MVNFILFVGVCDFRDTKAGHSDLSTHVSIVECDLGRVDLNLIGIAHIDLNSDLIALVVAMEGLAKANCVEIGQVAMHEDHVLLGEDEDRFVQICDLSLFSN